MSRARTATPLAPGHCGEAAAIIQPMRFDNLGQPWHLLYREPIAKSPTRAETHHGAARTP